MFGDMCRFITHCKVHEYAVCTECEGVIVNHYKSGCAAAMRPPVKLPWKLIIVSASDGASLAKPTSEHCSKAVGNMCIEHISLITRHTSSTKLFLVLGTEQRAGVSEPADIHATSAHRQSCGDASPAGRATRCSLGPCSVNICCNQTATQCHKHSLV